MKSAFFDNWRWLAVPILVAVLGASMPAQSVALVTIWAGEDLRPQYVPDLLVIVIRENAYSKDAERGNVRDIKYANVSVIGERAPRSSFNGLDARHTVEGVWLDNLRLNGKPAMTATEANLTVGPHVSGVHFGKAAN